jgi:hypothetical protein
MIHALGPAIRKPELGTAEPATLLVMEIHPIVGAMIESMIMIVGVTMNATRKEVHVPAIPSVTKRV